MKIIILLLLLTSLYAKETCYTVQLISKFNSQKNLKILQNEVYPNSCEVMEIGKSLTVRCECVDEYASAKKLLPKFKRDYNQATIVTTYKHRFSKKKTEPEANIKLEDKTPISLDKEQEVSNTKPVTKKAQDVQVLKVKEEEILVDEIAMVDDTLSQESISLATKKEKKKKKKKSKKKSKKKKKKSKTKYVKTRGATYPYTMYINKLSNDDGIGKLDYRYSFGAQVSYDLAYINQADTYYYVENDWRRVRIGHEGSFFDESLFYALEFSLIGANRYKDVYLGYQNKIRPLKTDYRVKYGNIKIPFSLERYSSSKNITFMERGLNDAFADGRKFGGELFLSSKIFDGHLNLMGAVFSNSIDDKIEDEVEQPGYAARVTYGYKFDKNHIVSLGGAYMNQDMKGKNTRFRQASESDFIKETYVSVKVSDVDTMIKNNIEAVYVYDKYSLMAEYTTVTTQTLEEGDYTFDGYYIQGSYFLLGRGKNYRTKASKLGKPKINKSGALELAFRYSHIDLNDRDEEGGTQTDYTYGVNWHFSDELKFMLNYVVAEPKETDDYDGRLQILQGRMLFAF